MMFVFSGAYVPQKTFAFRASVKNRKCWGWVRPIWDVGVRTIQLFIDPPPRGRRGLTFQKKNSRPLPTPWGGGGD